MDIVTQGIVGALAAQAIAGKEHSRRATVIGFIAGLPADADILIRSTSDPLLTLDFHRQFTHALLFIPFGGLLVAAIFWLLHKKNLPFKAIFPFALAGYATSGLLDACTSYGTQLLWPFSDERFAWSVISVVDPLFSLTLLLVLYFGWRAMNQRFAQMGWMFVAAYLSFGLLQQSQAAAVASTLAQQRGHYIERMVVKPTMGNLLVWRTVYQSGDRYYITAVRVSPFSAAQYHAGESLPLFDFIKDLAPLQKESVQVADIYRFNHFSDGYIAFHPDNRQIIGDVRYSLLPFGVEPLWGIVVQPERAGLHVPFESDRSQAQAAMRLFPKLISGKWEKWQQM